MEERTTKRKASTKPGEVVSSSNAADGVAASTPFGEAADVTTASAAATNAKKVKQEEKAVVDVPPEEEIILEWITYKPDGKWDDCEITHTISADDLIRRRVTLSGCKEAMMLENGEFRNRDFELKLVRREQPPAKQETQKDDTKSEKVLASLQFAWWEDSAKANLMHFNMKSKSINARNVSCNVVPPTASSC